MRLKQLTKQTIGLYLLLAFSAFLVPESVMDLPYILFLVLIGGYTYFWFKNLRKLYFQLNENHPKDNWNFLVYDLIYILGLPVIFNIIMFKVGRNLFNDMFYAYGYYLFVGVSVFVKLLLMANKGKAYYVFRFVITLLFITGNLFIINQIFYMWHGINFMGQGF